MKREKTVRECGVRKKVMLTGTPPPPPLMVKWLTP